MAGDNLVGLLSERDYVRKVKLERPLLDGPESHGNHVNPGRHRNIDGHCGRLHALHDEQALPPPPGC